MNRPLVYLAVPYSHPDPAIQEQRFRAANRVAGILMERGHVVFSPISHSHPIAEDYDLPREWAFWEAQDVAFLSVSSTLFVLAIDGWRESRGVTAEIAIAEERQIPVRLIDSSGNEISDATPSP